jgi:hypothetical protein
MNAPLGARRPVNTYRLHLRSDGYRHEQEVHATAVDKEDGSTIFWYGSDVILRIRDEDIVSLEHLI